MLRGVNPDAKAAQSLHSQKSMRHFLPLSLLPWLALCLVIGGPTALATTLVPGDFAQMARESELIVHGTVVNVQGQLTGSRQTIESVITVQVAETMKGTATAQTIFR